MEVKISLAFAKKGRMKYISHLDLMRLFGRALRRADLPFALTQGFSKHPKYSVKRALKLGLESENEEAEFALRENIQPDEFRRRLQEALPEGIEIVGARLAAKPLADPRVCPKNKLIVEADPCVCPKQSLGVI